ncbi:MAG: DUF4910 domain-containing protein [Candidatus Aminicenantes bacterium]|nr:MAG: DUF4910 domain-containing protein [Candidatus Aminicenantes bacterium]
MRKNSLYLLLASILILTSFLIPQNKVSILSEADIRALNNEISGELAQDYIRHIAHHSRLQPSRSYRQAAEWVAEQARKFGLSDVQIEEYPADGEKYYYMYKSSPAWDAEFAELWVVEPYEEKLTSYAEIPVSLAITSQSCDVKGELIYVGEGTSSKDYENIDVREKIVLADGYIGTVADLAVDQYGALGVVVINTRYAHDEPDNVSSIRLRTKNPTFGFGLSNRRGEELKARVLREEKMVVRAVVKAETHPWHYENVIATIPGAELVYEEILFTAHLCHYKPGANDNASGSACLLEIARALKRLIEEGKIKPPKRTLRFLWVPEMTGSIAYAATHPDIVEKTIAGINLDMVGQYLNDNNSTFFLHQTPDSRPHYINDILVNLTEFIAAHNVEPLMNRGGFSYPVYSLSGSRDAFRYRIADYVGGSDQWVFNDGLLGIPMAFFLVWPDRYYHTSGDKPEICDPTQLKRSSFLTAAAAVYLADDCPHKAQKLAGEVYNRAQSRIALEIKRSFDYLNYDLTETFHKTYKESINFIEQAYRREIATLASVKNYSQRDETVDRFVDELILAMKGRKKNSLEDLQKFYILSCKTKKLEAQEIVLSTEEIEAQKATPVRNPDLKGPLGRGYLQAKLEGIGTGIDINAVLSGGDSRATYEIFNFIDGKRSVLDIRNAVSAEYEPVSLKWVQEFIELLAKAGIIKFEK